MTEIFLSLPQLLNGVMITVVLTISSIILGFFLAVGMTTILWSDHRLFKKIIHLFIFFIRGTPLLVQIFLIYYGLGQFAWIRDSIIWPILLEPMACAIIALSLNSACYTTIILKAAIQSVPHNEIAACHAIGMPKWLAFRRIIFPRAFRIALPAYSNEVIMILKGTSLASTITLLDIMGVTQKLIGETYETIQFYFMAAVIYLILNAIIYTVFYFVQKKIKIPN